MNGTNLIYVVFRRSEVGSSLVLLLIFFGWGSHKCASDDSCSSILESFGSHMAQTLRPALHSYLQQPLLHRRPVAQLEGVPGPQTPFNRICTQDYVQLVPPGTGTPQSNLTRARRGGVLENPPGGFFAMA